jgi:hypothetical protein
MARRGRIGGIYTLLAEGPERVETNLVVAREFRCGLAKTGGTKLWRCERPQLIKIWIPAFAGMTKKTRLLALKPVPFGLTCIIHEDGRRYPINRRKTSSFEQIPALPNATACIPRRPIAVLAVSCGATPGFHENHS